MRKAYDSDVSREQFNPISRDLEFLKKKTRPREVDLYDVFCATLYQCQQLKHLCVGFSVVMILREALINPLWGSAPRSA
jgi:hypothetical protein